MEKIAEICGIEFYYIENNLYSIVSKFAKGEYDENRF